MTNQPESSASSPTDFVAPLEQAISSAERLDSKVKPVLQSLKAQGLPLAGELGTLIQSIRQSLKTAQRNGQQATVRLQQLQKLVDTSALLTSSLELDRVLEEVMDTINSLTGAERAYLMLRQSGSAELAIRAARNWDGENLDKTEVNYSRSIVNAVVDKGDPVLTTNAQMDDRFQGAQSVSANTLRSIVCIPLKLRGEIVGVLYADNRMKDGIFTQDAIPMLTAFANQAAIAIENARLYAKVKADLEDAQQQMQKLRIQIDEEQADSQIEEITGSQIFKRLARRDPPADND
jgi:GAF domain-containing protein